LERILSSPLFRKSKRFPNLLRFVVERSLHGHSEPLKERTLGIEVFGRAPDYDTNLDPVVRTTAVEIRKTNRSVLSRRRAPKRDPHRFPRRIVSS